MSARASELLDAMTLDEKIGQITQVEQGSITPDEVAELAIGSVLSGGGGNPDPNTPASWRTMVDGFVAASRRSRLGIPILYGTDAVHGHNNVVGATIFPHNLALGAAGDADLVRRIGRATARETAATGARWTFAPTVAVPQDLRWGRTYEGYGQDPALVAHLGAALVEGLQGEGSPGEGAQDERGAIDVLACAKHFVADGATTWGTTAGAEWVDWWVRAYGGDGWHLDQGDARIDETTLRAVHLPPYRAAIERGVGSIMASYSSWNGTKVHAHRGLLTELLKGELGFDGFVVSDWMAVDQVDPDLHTAVARCLDAGVDLVMVPFDHARFRGVVHDLLASGDLRLDRLDDAVLRILRVKDAMGLLADEMPPLPSVDEVGCAPHRALAREAAAAGTVILRDDRGVLPLPDAGRVLVAGAAADDVGLLCGGWTIEWMGAAGPITPGTTLADGLRQHLGDRRLVTGATAEEPSALDAAEAELGIVVVHEAPYAEGLGDRSSLALDPAQLDLVAAVADRVERTVLVVVSGRPLVLGPALERVDAVVAAWWPGSEAAGVADVLAGARPATGRLPVDWPAHDDQLDPTTGTGAPRWARGHGLTTSRTSLG
jgi:beta-glucosidase